MADLFTNNAQGALAVGIDADDLLLTLENGQGAAFPLPSNGHVFRVTLQDNAGNIEIMTCTARNADLLTVQRGSEGTTPRAFLAGTPVGLRLTAGALTGFMVKANNLSDVSSVSSARTNLGLGTAATQADDRYAHRSNNLSDLANLATARTNLSLVIGQHVQAYNIRLDQLAGLARTLNGVIIGDGTNWTVLAGAELRTALGLGSMATRNVTVSDSDPSGGNDGDLWFKREA